VCLCLGPIEFVEPDLAGLLPISPPPDGSDKRENVGGVGANERTKKEVGGDYKRLKLFSCSSASCSSLRNVF